MKPRRDPDSPCPAPNPTLLQSMSEGRRSPEPLETCGVLKRHKDTDTRSASKDAASKDVDVLRASIVAQLAALTRAQEQMQTTLVRHEKALTHSAEYATKRGVSEALQMINQQIVTMSQNEQTSRSTLSEQAGCLEGLRDEVCRAVEHVHAFREVHSTWAEDYGALLREVEGWRMGLEDLRSGLQAAGDAFQEHLQCVEEAHSWIAADILLLAKGKVTSEEMLRTYHWNPDLSTSDEALSVDSLTSPPHSTGQAVFSPHVHLRKWASVVEGACPSSEEPVTPVSPTSVSRRSPWAVAPSTQSAVSGGSSAKASRNTHHKLTEDVLLQICAVDICANSYRVKLSVWDASLFLFYPQLGSIANGLLLFSLVCNSAVQLLFVYVVFFFFGHEVLSDETVAGFWTWRAAVDEGTREMVCSHDTSLSMDTFQVEIFEELTRYTAGHGVAAGPLLCSLLLITLCMTVLGVLRDVVDFMLASWHMTHGAVSRIHITEHLGNFIMEAIPWHRALWAFTITILQIFIALLLLVGGAFTLISMTDINDLMLTAVALSCVVEVDEAMYNVLVPRRVKALMQHMVPIPICRRPELVPQWLPLRSLVSCTFLVLFLLAMVVYGILPHVNDVDRAMDALCAGFYSV